MKSPCCSGICGSDSRISLSIEGTDVGVSCIVADDGAFSLPAGTVAELGSGFSGTLDDVSRQAIAFEQRGDAVLFVINSAGTP